MKACHQLANKLSFFAMHRIFLKGYTCMHMVLPRHPSVLGCNFWRACSSSPNASPGFLPIPHAGSSELHTNVQGGYNETARMNMICATAYSKCGTSILYSQIMQVCLRILSGQRFMASVTFHCQFPYPWHNSIAINIQAARGYGIHCFGW